MPDYTPESATLENVLAKIPGLGSYIAYKRYLQDEQMRKQAMKDQMDFRQEREALGPNANLEQLMGVAQTKVSPETLMRYGESALTRRQAQEEALRQRRDSAEQMQRIIDMGRGQTSEAPQELGAGQPIAVAGEQPQSAQIPKEVRLAQIDAMLALPQVSGHEASRNSLMALRERLLQESAPSVHLVQDKTSPTGWSHVDVKTGKILVRGAPPPAGTAERVATPMSAEGKLTDDAIEQAATRYNTLGTLPTNLGRGAQGSINTALILKRAAELAKESGDSPSATTVNQVANRASQMALGQLTKQKNLILAFEKNAVMNADLVLQESEKVDRLGSPVIDRWIQAGKKQIGGDPAVARLDTAMRTFVNEYARVTTSVTGGGITSDTARREIETLLRSAQTKEQVRGVVDLMKTEMENRKKGYEQQEAELKGSIRPSAAPAAPVSVPTASPYVETRVTASGKKLGKKADGTIEEIK